MPNLDVLGAPGRSPGASPNTSEATCLRRTASTSLRKVSIASLPVEMLVKIFVEVCRSYTFDPFSRKWSPRTLASVCSFWNATTLFTPEFWTRLTFSLDAPDFSAACVTSILVRSRNLILETVTFARNISNAMNDEQERARVIMAMQAIASHMHRCRAIAFHVRFSSSLPSFPNDFHGNAVRLDSLDLRCTEDDGGAISTIDEASQSSLHEPFQCPNLHNLVIDGRNYFNAWQENVDWTEMFPAVSTLSISHFTPARIFGSFSIYGLLLSLVPLRDLTYLSIDNVRLCDLLVPDLDQDYFPELTTIVLKDLTYPVTPILNFVGWPPNVHITRCRLDYEYVFEAGVYVSLKEIDVRDNLVAFLAYCVSEKLVIDDCPGFCDQVLNSMMIATWDPLTQETWCSCAPHVKDLSIINCRSFSIAALKQLVEARLTWTITPFIKTLRLSGRVPDVSSEDIEWFKGRVSEFSYDPIP